MNRFRAKPGFLRSYVWRARYINQCERRSKDGNSIQNPTDHGQGHMTCVWKLDNQTPTHGKWNWSFTKIDQNWGSPSFFMALRQWLYTILAFVKTLVESFVDRSGFPAFPCTLCYYLLYKHVTSIGIAKKCALWRLFLHTSLYRLVAG